MNDLLYKLWQRVKKRRRDEVGNFWYRARFKILLVNFYRELAENDESWFHPAIKFDWYWPRLVICAGPFAFHLGWYANVQNEHLQANGLTQDEELKLISLGLDTGRLVKLPEGEVI